MSKIDELLEKLKENDMVIIEFGWGNHYVLSASEAVKVAEILARAELDTRSTTAVQCQALSNQPNRKEVGAPILDVSVSI